MSLWGGQLSFSLRSETKCCMLVDNSGKSCVIAQDKKEVLQVIAMELYDGSDRQNDGWKRNKKMKRGSR